VAEAREHVLRFDWGEVARQTNGVYRKLERAKPLRPARHLASPGRGLLPGVNCLGGRRLMGGARP